MAFQEISTALGSCNLFNAGLKYLWLEVILHDLIFVREGDCSLSFNVLY
jgi:hypothetical protein